MPLPPYYLEVIMVGGMACYGTVLIDSRGGLQVLFVSFTKGPGGFPYVFIITAKVVALVPVYGTTLVEHRVLVLRGDQKVFDGFATLEVSYFLGLIFIQFITVLALLRLTKPI